MFFNLRERSSSIDKIRDPVRVPTEFQPASKVFAWCGRQNHLRRQCGWTGGCDSPLFRAAYRQNRPAPPDRRPKESNAVSYYFRTNFTVSYRQNCRSAHPPPTTDGTNTHYNIPQSLRSQLWQDVFRENTAGKALRKLWRSLTTKHTENTEMVTGHPNS